MRELFHLDKAAAAFHRESERIAKRTGYDMDFIALQQQEPLCNHLPPYLSAAQRDLQNILLVVFHGSHSIDQHLLSAFAGFDAGLAGIAECRNTRGISTGSCRHGWRLDRG